MAPTVYSTSIRNEYHGYLLKGEGGLCVGLKTLPLSCADFLEIEDPQLSGALRASSDL
jgi:hypothetical protein